MDGVCEARSTSLAYSLRMEWLGLDGVPWINSSVRVEWTGPNLEESRAVCEMEVQSTAEYLKFDSIHDNLSDNFVDLDLTTHISQCLFQLLSFTALILLLSHGVDFQVVHLSSYLMDENDSLPLDWLLEFNISTSAEPANPFVDNRRCLSACAILQRTYSSSIFADVTRFVIKFCSMK